MLSDEIKRDTTDDADIMARSLSKANTQQNVPVRFLLQKNGLIKGHFLNVGRLCGTQWASLSENGGNLL